MPSSPGCTRNAALAPAAATAFSNTGSQAAAAGSSIPFAGQGCYRTVSGVTSMCLRPSFFYALPNILFPHLVHIAVLGLVLPNKYSGVITRLAQFGRLRLLSWGLHSPSQRYTVFDRVTGHDGVTGQNRNSINRGTNLPRLDPNHMKSSKEHFGICRNIFRPLVPYRERVWVRCI